jgi:hypothetical protein
MTRKGWDDHDPDEEAKRSGSKTDSTVYSATGHLSYYTLEQRVRFPISIFGLKQQSSSMRTREVAIQASTEK